MPLSIRGLFGTRGLSDEFPEESFPATARRPDEEYRRPRSRLRRWTYQDSHFCSRDVPGASRSELDADCRRFLALYTRHTFAFATRGPVGSGAPSRIPPRYTSLFSYDDDGPTVPSDHHSPLGQTPHSPSPTNTRAAKKHSSPSSTNGFRSLPPSSSARAMLDFFFFSLLSHIFAGTLAALWFYMILSLRNDGHTDRYRRGLPLGSEAADRNIDRVFPVRANAQIDPLREKLPFRT